MNKENDSSWNEKPEHVKIMTSSGKIKMKPSESQYNEYWKSAQYVRRAGHPTYIEKDH